MVPEAAPDAGGVNVTDTVQLAAGASTVGQLFDSENGPVAESVRKLMLLPPKLVTVMVWAALVEAIFCVKSSVGRREADGRGARSGQGERHRSVNAGIHPLHDHLTVDFGGQNRGLAVVDLGFVAVAQEHHAARIDGDRFCSEGSQADRSSVGAGHVVDANHAGRYAVRRVNLARRIDTTTAAR